MTPAAVDLYWIPLGAGSPVVQRCGRMYERIAATLSGREPAQLYHCGLKVLVFPDVFVIEMAPAWQFTSIDRGVVLEGPVGTRWAGRSKWLRYEVRCWRNGLIPDEADAVCSPLRLTTDPVTCRQVLRGLVSVPRYTWGRDSVGVGDMWNSNSVVSWVLSRSGVDLSAVRPPRCGRVPGWQAGIAAASQDRY
ncbi:hypothetical protein A6I85_00385 [Prescottella equi]|nr:hypothetical protein A6I85_00385 [Prescottella equi]